VWAAGPGDAYAVGSAIHHFDGVSWSEVWSGGPSAYLDAVWGSGPTDIWVSGSDGRLVHGDGTVWAERTSGTFAQLVSIHGTGPRDVFIVGRAPGFDAVILHFNGSSWRTIPAGVSEYMGGVWAAAAGDAYIVADDGTALRCDGTTVAPWTSPSGFHNLECIWGSSASRIFVGDNFGVLYRWNGTAWSAEPTGTAQDIWSIWGSGPYNVFAVGADGLVLHRCGTGW